MIVYSALLVYLLVLAFIGREVKLSSGGYRDGLLLVLAVLAFFALVALRSSSVGADTIQCQRIFISAGTMSYDEFFSPSAPYWCTGAEIGYWLYNRILYAICPFLQTITVVNSALFCFFAWRLIKKESSDMLVSAV